ncbi:MAG: DUF86 domain-containing protein [Planctomycetes bacterium]|nr:DUF86 domain-containing protein [Planctomycetota bacterium]
MPALDFRSSQEQVEVWRRIVGFRNLVVHRYLEVDPAIVRGMLETSSVDLSDFVRSIRSP